MARAGKNEEREQVSGSLSVNKENRISWYLAVCVATPAVPAGPRLLPYPRDRCAKEEGALVVSPLGSQEGRSQERFIQASLCPKRPWHQQFEVRPEFCLTTTEEQLAYEHRATPVFTIKDMLAAAAASIQSSSRAFINGQHALHHVVLKPVRLDA